MPPPSSPSFDPDRAQETWVLEARGGAARRALLEQLAAEAEAAGRQTFLLDCGFERAGLWTGLDSLLQAIHDDLLNLAPEVIERHSFELATVLPALRRRVQVRNESLTDTGPAAERTRNYSVDRAYRILQGLIDLFMRWRAIRGESRPVLILCDTFDDAGRLVRRFFAELMRRRGKALSLILVLAAEPGAGAAATDYPGFGERRYFVRDLPADPPAEIDREKVAARADQLEAAAKANTLDLQLVLPELIACLRLLGDEKRLVVWQAVAFGVYNHFGFYEDSYRYSAVVLRNLDYLCQVESPTKWTMSRWNLVGNIYGCYLGNDRFEEALQVVTEEALAKIDNPLDRPRILWALSMLYVRYLPERDFAKAEALLLEGIGLLDDPGIEDHHRYFLHTFIENGLALVRHRQGRPEEAIELCRRGFERLEKHLSPNSHRLHRSVLLYNIAQVFSSMRASEEAIRYYSEAMKMDPNYSEYYNERGGLYLQLGRLDEAQADLEKAVLLSSPYQEVLTNLGQLYRLREDWEKAAAAYDQAIDLDPDQILPHIGRAEAREALGDAAGAILDYSRAIELDPGDPLLLANRAGLYYDQGEILASLADLDRAVTLAPQRAELYENRAIALAELGRLSEARRDLGRALELAEGDEEYRLALREKLAGVAAEAAA